MLSMMKQIGDSCKIYLSFLFWPTWFSNSFLLRGRVKDQTFFPLKLVVHHYVTLPIHFLQVFMSNTHVRCIFRHGDMTRPVNGLGYPPKPEGPSEI